MSRRLRLALVSLMMLLLIWQGVFAVRVIISDILNFSVQRAVVLWGVNGRKPSPEELGKTEVNMESALRLWPLHPDYLSLRARLYAWQAQTATSRPAVNAAYIQALTTMHQSLVERPGNPYSWAQYAEYLSTQRDKRLELRLVVDKVKTLGAGDAGLQKRMQALGEH